MSSTKVYLSTLGRPVDPADAQISVFDRGFLYGDSVYETMRTSGGNPVEIGRHLDRLTRSAAGIGLEIPFSHADIEAAIAQTHAASGNAESYERVIVTRGAGPIALDTRKSEDPTLVIVVQPLKLPEPEQLRGADEVFLTSSVRGIMPVTQVDGQAVGQGGIGPVTRDLMQRYEAYLRRWAE